MNFLNTGFSPSTGSPNNIRDEVGSAARFGDGLFFGNPNSFSSAEYTNLLANHGGSLAAAQAYYDAHFQSEPSVEEVLVNVQENGRGTLEGYADYINQWHENNSSNHSPQPTSRAV